MTQFAERDGHLEGEELINQVVADEGWTTEEVEEARQRIRRRAVA